MSDSTKSKDYNDWLEKSISEGHTDCFEYSDFKNIHTIERGNFGTVSRANWKNSNRFVALKSYDVNKTTLKEFVKEVPFMQLL